MCNRFVCKYTKTIYSSSRSVGIRFMTTVAFRESLTSSTN